MYVYKDPETEPTTTLDTYPDPWRRLDIANPSYLSFSSNTQFLLAESGQHFIVYDLENVIQYQYTAKQPLDQSQGHAAWMDGDRLMYVGSGKLNVFDYDYQNQQTLMPADAGYLVAFDASYGYVFAIAPELIPAKDSASGLYLSSTSLRTPADQ